MALVGIRAEIPFFKGTLDKLDVEAQFDRRALPEGAVADLQNEFDWQ